MRNKAGFSAGEMDYTPEAFASVGGYCHPDAAIYLPTVLVELSRIRIAQGARIDPMCVVSAGKGVEFGPRTHIAAGVTVLGGGSLRTGWCVGIGAGVRIVTGSDDPREGLCGACIPDEFRAVRRGEVDIDDFAIVFTAAVILPGVRIGQGAVVAAGSVVHRSLEAWGVYAGNPVRRIGFRDSQKAQSAAQAMLDKYGF